MPIRHRKPAHRRRARRVRRAPLKRNVALRAQSQYSSAQESIDFNVSVLSNSAIYQVVSLENFPRMYQMSRLFEFFRIEELIWTYRPYWNTFQEPSTGVVSAKPNLWLSMDRANTQTSPTTVKMAQQGVRGRPFEKQIVFKYKPNSLVTTNATLQATAGILLQSNAVKYNQWQPCQVQNIPTADNPEQNTFSGTTTDYYGHWAICEQIGAGTVPAYSYTVTARVSFKNPMVTQIPSGLADSLKPYTPRVYVTPAHTDQVIGDVSGTISVPLPITYTS